MNDQADCFPYLQTVSKMITTMQPLNDDFEIFEKELDKIQKQKKIYDDFAMYAAVLEIMGTFSYEISIAAPKCPIRKLLFGKLENAKLHLYEFIVYQGIFCINQASSWCCVIFELDKKWYKIRFDMDKVQICHFYNLALRHEDLVQLFIHQKTKFRLYTRSDRKKNWQASAPWNDMFANFDTMWMNCDMNKDNRAMEELRKTKITQVEQFDTIFLVQDARLVSSQVQVMQQIKHLQIYVQCKLTCQQNWIHEACLTQEFINMINATTVSQCVAYFTHIRVNRRPIWSPLGHFIAWKAASAKTITMSSYVHHIMFTKANEQMYCEVEQLDEQTSPMKFVRFLQKQYKMDLHDMLVVNFATKLTQQRVKHIVEHGVTIHKTKFIYFGPRNNEKRSAWFCNFGSIPIAQVYKDMKITNAAALKYWLAPNMQHFVRVDKTEVIDDIFKEQENTVK